MKIDISIPGKPKDKSEYYIKCKKPEQLPIVLEAVSKYGTWSKFTDRSLHSLDCSLGTDELRNIISSETELTEKEVYIIDPNKRFWPYWLP